MPLTNTPETLNILNTDFRMPEHCGGDRWSLLHGDSLQIIRQFEPNSFDAIITDPPRAGMHPDVIQVILNAAPGRIVYVSCNPATQARDLQLMDDYYKVGAVQPVDMFPHTPHVENVVLLEKRSDADIKQKLKERKEREQAIAEAKAAKEAEALAKAEAQAEDLTEEEQKACQA